MNKYQYLESITLQYQIKEGMKSRIWMNRKGFELRIQKKESTEQWSKIPPLAPTLNEPLADIGPLSNDTIGELKDDHVENIWYIHHTNKRIEDGIKYRDESKDNEVNDNDQNMEEAVVKSAEDLAIEKSILNTAEGKETQDDMIMWKSF